MAPAAIPASAPQAAGERADERASRLVGESPALRTLLGGIERVAAAPRTTVLITGESGVGKELVAREVHARSKAAAGPFIALNCAALNEGLLEAELFGYERGAFTGAERDGREGLFAAAAGGTLFLDEVGELAPALQAKLLRVLQERVYRPVGASHELPVEARIVAATNRDLDDEVAAGRFRADLFYRLNVLALRVPALRERREDLPLLAEHFRARAEAELESPRRLSRAALDALSACDWHGNVRELENTVRRACVLAPSERIDVGDLDLPADRSPRAATAAQDAGDDGTLVLSLANPSLRAMEEALVRRVLTHADGNKKRAAELLGINRQTLYNKLRAFGAAS